MKLLKLLTMVTGFIFKFQITIKLE